MKAVILAGGLGTRFAEETTVRPKPLIEIGGKPILWHVMNVYAAHGVRDFIVACGYKGEMIKDYFHNFHVRHSDIAVRLASGAVSFIGTSAPDWNVECMDTGQSTMTGGRIRRLRPLVGSSTFMATYGDGVGDVDVRSLLEFHRAHGRMATLTAVRPPGRFGALELEGGQVRKFAEKAQLGEGWINGGFFVFEPGVFDYISGDDSVLERETLERLALDGELMAYRHSRFWQPMDALRDKLYLEQLWETGKAPWKVW